MKQNIQGLLRLKEVLEIIPVSKSTWWAGVKNGKFPQSIKLSDKVTCWKAEDIYELIERCKSANGGE